MERAFTTELVVKGSKGWTEIVVKGSQGWTELRMKGVGGLIRSICYRVGFGSFDRPLVGDADRRMRGGGGLGVLACWVYIGRLA